MTYYKLRIFMSMINEIQRDGIGREAFLWTTKLREVRSC
jgi:hypothetical protein